MKHITTHTLMTTIEALKRIDKPALVSKDLLIDGEILALELYPQEWVELLSTQLKRLLTASSDEEVICPNGHIMDKAFNFCTECGSGLIKKPTLEEWLAQPHDGWDTRQEAIDCELAENGTDREGDFDIEAEQEKRYEAFLEETNTAQ